MRISRCAVWLVVLSVVNAGTAVAETPQEVAAEIDRLLRAEIEGSGAAPANDEVFLRRVFLDLIGEVPSPDDVLIFSLEDAADKRPRLIDTLLNDEAFGRNWGRYWRDVVMSRRTEDRARLASQSMEDFFANALNDNRPWDLVAEAIITAEGDVQEDGATGLIMAQAGLPEETVAEISRIFLGIQIQCAQCHDHPTDRWKREQFHELAAFFPRVAVRPDRSGDRRSYLVTVNDGPARRRGSNNVRFRGSPEHQMPNMEDPEAPGQVMRPTFFLTGDSIPLGTVDAERRETLADWLTRTEQPWFATAMVNRLWAELVGEGFYEPIDDLGPDRTPHAPRTVAYLSEQFAASDYDVKWLFATILNTEAYAQRSANRRLFRDAPFQANCVQRLRGDQVYNALTAVLGLDDTPLPSRGGQYGPRASVRVAFNEIFGFDPSENKDEISATIPQALALMNSPQINRAISAQSGPLAWVLGSYPDDEDAFDQLYLLALSRPASASEKRICRQYRREVSDRGEAFEDLLWALINSAEFRHRQ